jgi:Leu/Phe-tRNA-protein transferase
MYLPPATFETRFGKLCSSCAHERSTSSPWIDHKLISKTKKALSGRELSRKFFEKQE